MDVAAKVKFLLSNELFADVAPEALQSIALAFEPRAIAARSVLFDQGTAGPGIYVIAKGVVELRRRDAVTGVDLLISMHGPPGAVGVEMALHQDASPCYAIAREPTNALFLDAARFHQVISRLPAVSAAVARLLARRSSRLYGEKGVRFVSLQKHRFDTEVLAMLPTKLMKEHRIVPLHKRANVLTVAMSDPHDLAARDAAQRVLRDMDLEVVGVSEGDLERAMAKLDLGKIEKVAAETQAIAVARVLPVSERRNHEVHFIQHANRLGAGDDDGRQQAVGGEQIIQHWNQIIGDALQLDASDIHIEPQENEVVIRYRIDGELWRRREEIPHRFQAALVSRMKAIAGMDITERRKPQDGRLGVRSGGQEVALRISTVPTPFGEKIVMRVLNASAALMSLDRTIAIPTVRELVRSLIFQPYGMVLVTGPTGSGKTTTMYSAVLERKEEGVNIVTIEDPIEYTIPGITQVQYNEAIHLTYAEAIRAFLRQDPDIIMVGETRDPKTAHNAMQAALSGHLVVTSLHTNSALGTIYRLTEMGVEPVLVGQALAGVVAQRLVRQVCPHCSTEHRYDQELVRRIYERASDIPKLFRGRGCAHCNGSGYSGRVAVVEVLKPSEDLRNAIGAKTDVREIRRLAEEAGMITLRECGQHLLARGLTTPHDLMRVLLLDDAKQDEEESVRQAEEAVVAAAARPAAAAAAAGPRVQCPSCGASNPAGSKFCVGCGSAL